jgi:hypothetical protein
MMNLWPVRAAASKSARPMKCFLLVLDIVLGFSKVEAEPEDEHDDKDD